MNLLKKKGIIFIKKRGAIGLNASLTTMILFERD